MCSNENSRIAQQHLKHFHPEFAPVKRYELDEQVAVMTTLIAELRRRVDMLEKERP